MIKQSITLKLTIIILLISLTPLLLLASFSYLEKVQTETTHAKEILQQLTDFGAQHINNQLSEAKSATHAIATLPAFIATINALLKNPSPANNTSAERDVLEYISLAIRANPSLQEGYVRDTRGEIIFSSSRISPHRTLARETSFASAMNGYTNQSDIIPSIEPFPNEHGAYEIGVPVLFVSSPIINSGKIAAVLTFRVDALSIPRSPIEYHLNTKSGEAYLVNSEGYLISQNRHFAHAQELGLIRKRPEFELRVIDPITKEFTPPFLTARTNETTTNIKGYRDYRGILTVGAARKVPNTDWTYIVELDKSEAFAGITALQRFLFAELILTATAIITISIFSGNYATRPLLTLLRGAEALKKGNFGFRTRIQTHDELENLSHAFNRAAQQLGKLESQRQQIDRAKTRFLSITSHELRSPMTPMKAQLQMLSSGYFGKLRPLQKTSVRTVLRNAERLDKILQDFLDLSRIEAGRLKLIIRKTNLKKLITETVKLNETYVPEKKIKFATHLPKLPTVQTDPDRLTQIISNLLTNACKFSPPKSTITITARPLRSHVLLSVKDEGIGISSKDQQKLFEPFSQVEQTLSRKHQGTGLGLAICKGILLALGGRIWIESTPGKGSTFYVTIPLKTRTNEQPVHSIFGADEDWNANLQHAFRDTLGPRGTKQFAHLQKEGLLSKKDILRYVRNEEKTGRLTHAQAQELAKKVTDQSTA